MRNVSTDLGLAEVSLAKRQPQYREIVALPVIDEVTKGEGFLTRWRFEDAERDAIAAPMVARALLTFVRHLAEERAEGDEHLTSLSHVQLLQRLEAFAEKWGIDLDSSRGSDPADFWLEELTFGANFTPVRLYVGRTAHMLRLLGVDGYAESQR